MRRKNSRALKKRVAQGAALAIFVGALTFSIYQFSLVDRNRVPTLSTTLPYAISLVDSGLVAVVLDRAYGVGETYLLPGKQLLYSSKACFDGHLVEKRTRISFPNRLEIDLKDGAALKLSALGLEKLNLDAQAVTRIIVDFGDEAGQVGYEATSLATLIGKLRKNVADCSEVRAAFNSFETGAPVGRTSKNVVLTILEVYRGKQRISIEGNFMSVKEVDHVVELNGGKASIQSKRNTVGGTTIVVRREQEEVFAVRPALVPASPLPVLGGPKAEQSDNNDPLVYRSFSSDPKRADIVWLRRALEGEDK